MKSIQQYAEEQKHEKKIGKKSKVVLQLKGNEVLNLQIQINDDEIGPGTYDVSFSCLKPGNSMIFAEALIVGEDGYGEFKKEIKLDEDVYDVCQVLFGTVLITFDKFLIVPGRGLYQKQENDIIVAA